MERLYKEKPKSGKDLYVADHMYDWSLKKRAEWIDSMQSRLGQQYKSLSDEQKQMYKQRAARYEKESENDEEDDEDDYKKRRENMLKKLEAVVSEPAQKKRRLNDSEPIAYLGPLSINSDCLLIVMSYFSAQGLTSLRGVNRWFDQVATSDFLWKCLFVTDFYGDLPSEDLEEMADFMSQYVQCYTSIPKVLDVPLKGDEVDAGGEDVEDESYYETRYQDYSILRMDLPEIGSTIHQLAAILAILNRGGYVPKLTDTVRIGYSHNNKQILLSQFCYAILEYRTSDLFPEENIPNCSEDKDDDDEEDDEDDDDYEDFNRKELNRTRLVSLGIAPNIEGNFEPFVYFKEMEGRRRELEKFKKSLYFLEAALIGNLEDITSAYEFRSDEKGWITPNFFNASFSWFNEAKIYTIHKSNEKRIYVVKKEKGVAVF